jgi:hypothetical protein
MTAAFQAMEAMASLFHRCDDEERPAIREGGHDERCCVCYAAPRYRKNSHTCRSEVCRTAWSRQRNARKNHAYRLRKFDTDGRRLLDDPALLVELAERARRAIAQNPVTEVPQNPVTPLVHSSVTLTTPNTNLHTVSLPQDLKQDNPCPIQDTGISLSPLHTDLLQEKDSHSLNRGASFCLSVSGDDGRLLSPRENTSYKEVVFSREVTPLGDPHRPSTKETPCGVNTNHKQPTIGTHQVVRISGSVSTRFPPEVLLGRYPRVCDSELDTIRPFRDRIEQLIHEVSRLARERTRDAEYGDVIFFQAHGGRCSLLEIGEDLLHLAELVDRHDKAMLRRLVTLPPDLIFKLGRVMYVVAETLNDVCQDDDLYRHRGWDAMTTIAWNAEHSARCIDLPYAITPLAFVIDPYRVRGIPNYGLFERASRALDQLYRLARNTNTCQEGYTGSPVSLCDDDRYYPRVLKSELDTFRPLLGRIDQLICEVTNAFRIRTTDLDELDMILQEIGDEVSSIAAGIERCDPALIRRLSSLPPESIFKLACMMHNAGAALREVGDKEYEPRWDWECGTFKQTREWNEEHPKRFPKKALPYPVPLLALAVDLGRAEAIENAGLVLYRLYRLVWEESESDQPPLNSASAHEPVPTCAPEVYPEQPVEAIALPAFGANRLLESRGVYANAGAKSHTIIGTVDTPQLFFGTPFATGPPVGRILYTAV